MMQGQRPPVLVLNANTKRESGDEAQKGTIQAAKAVSNIIRSSLGPKSMMKMILSDRGQLLITNDGNAILREVSVAHPAAKTLIDLSKSQDENVGDGTTSVVILAGEVLSKAEALIDKRVHPHVIIAGYTKALEDALNILKGMSKDIDASKKEVMIDVIKTCISTKFIARYEDFMCGLAAQAVGYVKTEIDGRLEVDLKRYCYTMKVPGGEIMDCRVVPGVVMNKDVTHANMRRRIENPRVILLDCTLEYKKGESQSTVDIMDENAFMELLQQEEQYVKNLCDAVLKFKPDLVVTEKGCSDLAQHYFQKAGVTALRRLKKTDNDRLARATGATIVHRPSELKESDVGTAELFEVRKMGDEYYSFIECKDPRACTILLRGAMKDLLSEVERGLQDALFTARNIIFEPKLVPGGGACEMELSVRLREKAKEIAGVEQWAYTQIADALEVIPRTLATNCGQNVVKVINSLKAKHASGENATWGLNGIEGTIVDQKEYGVWEPYQVKAQTIKTAIEAANMLLRVDMIVSGVTSKNAEGGPGGPGGPPGGPQIPPGMM